MKRRILLVGFLPAWLLAFPLRLFGKKDMKKLRWWTLDHWTVYGPEVAFIFGVTFWIIVFYVILIITTRNIHN